MGSLGLKSRARAPLAQLQTLLTSAILGKPKGHFVAARDVPLGRGMKESGG